MLQYNQSIFSISHMSGSEIISVYQRNLCFYPQETKAGISWITKKSPADFAKERKETL